MAREEGFELAQWALQTGAADALVQMSVRFAVAPKFGNLAEESLAWVVTKSKQTKTPIGAGRGSPR